tara:strand:- start:3564 stop:3806 length:243 start_codon:yes stop_codon:yes gene_type:complete
MVALRKPHDVKVMTKDGECKLHITLDLNINLTTDKIEVSVAGAQATPGAKAAETDEDVHWAIPNFEEDESEKIDFGKDVD